MVLAITASSYLVKHVDKVFSALSFLRHKNNIIVNEAHGIFHSADIFNDFLDTLVAELLPGDLWDDTTVTERIASA